jgi:hypothetical protein
VSWVSEPPSKQGPWTFQTCLSYNYGLCVAYGPQAQDKSKHVLSIGITAGEGVFGGIVAPANGLLSGLGAAIKKLFG